MDSDPEDEHWIRDTTIVLDGFTDAATGLLEVPVPSDGPENFNAVAENARLSAALLMSAINMMRTAIEQFDTDILVSAAVVMGEATSKIEEVSEDFMVVCEH